MVVRKRKKNSRQRGSKTHGWGAMKKHRGAGNRGGRGLAGTGKRADQMKTLYWKERYFGKVGFRPGCTKEDIKAINIGFIDENADSFLSSKLIEKKDDIFVVDLQKLGYNKLLGKGRVTKKFRITAKYASGNVSAKVEKAGGEVILSG